MQKVFLNDIARKGKENFLRTSLFELVWITSVHLSIWQYRINIYRRKLTTYGKCRSTSCHYAKSLPVATAKIVHSNNEED